MADWSVVGEILGETNLDEVGESVERSLQDAANATEKAAAGSEAMEKSMDSATEAVASLGAASENTDDQLEEVEAELEDIVTDAGAAAGSVNILNSSLQGVRDIDDLDIDVDTDIDALNEAWADMRNEIDDFEHRFDDIIPRGPGGGAPAEDFLGDRREVENTIDALDDAQDTMAEIAEERDHALGGDDGDIADPFRRIDAGGDVFRRALGEQLRPGGRFETVNTGRLASTLGGEQQAGDLARALSQRSDIGSEFGEALEAVLRAEEIQDAVEDAPFPRVGGDQLGGGRARIADPDILTGVPGDAIEKDDLLPGEVMPGTSVGPFSERDQDLIEIETDRLDAVARKSLADLGEIPQGAITGLDRDRIEVTKEAADQIGMLGDEATDAARQIGQFGERATDRGGTGVGAIGSTFTGAAGSRALDRIMRDDTDDGPSGLRRHFNNLSDAAVQTETTLGFMIATLSTYAGSARTAAHATDELDDDVEDLARSLAAAAPAVQNLSANLGPFNVSMSNLLVTIPALIATVGPFIAVMAGLAGAMVAVVGAFGAFLALGAIEFIEDIKNNFAGIETTGEAVMAIMRGLKESIIDALEPLESVEIGGLGAQGIFVTVLRDIVALIGMFAEAAAALLNMDEVESFLLNMRKAVLGLEGAGMEGISMIEGLKQMMAGALPVLEGFLMWLIDVTPEFLAFIGEITSEAGPAIASFANSLLRLSVLLTEAGTGAMSVLFPALGLVFDVLSVGLSLLLTFERTLGNVSNVIVSLGVVVVGLGLLFVKLAGTVNAAFETMNAVTETLDAMNNAVTESDTVFEAYNKSVANANSRMVRFLHLSLVAAARLVIFAAGLYLVLDALGLLQPLIKFLNDSLAPMVNSFREMTTAMGEAVGIGDTLTRVIEATVGVFLMATAAGAFFTGSMYSAATAMGSAILTGIGLIGTLGNLAAQAIFTGLAHLGLADAQAAQALSQKGLIARTWTTIASMSALRLAVLAAGGALFIFGAAVAAGLVELEELPVVGDEIADVLETLNDLLGINAENAEAAIGAMIALTGATWAYTGSAKAAAIWTGRLAKVLIFLGIALAGLDLATGKKDLEDFGAVGRWVAGVLEWLANAFNSIPIINTETSKEQLEGFLGFITSVIGSIGILHTVLAAFTNISVFGWLVAGAKWLAGVLAGIGATTAAIVAIVAVAAAIFTDWALNMEETVAKFERVFDILGQKIAETEGLVRFFWILLASLAAIVIVPFQELFKLILNPGQTVSGWADWISAGIEAIKNALIGVWNWVAGGLQNFVDDVAQWLGRKVDEFISWLQEGVDTVTGQGGSGVGSRVAQAAGINSLFKSDGSGIDLTFGHDVPFAAEGGFVQSSGLAMVHSNEMIVPVEKFNQMAANVDVGAGAPPTARGQTTGGGGTTVNVNIQNGGGDIDDRRARQIGRIARRSIAEQRRFEDGR